MHKHWSVTIFREGRNFDLWHVSHFLAGILFACLVLFLKIELYTGFIISFALMIGWEVFEINLGIKETKFNMYFDVVFSVVAFWLTVYLDKNYLSDGAYQDLFWVSLKIYILMGVWGFYAFKMRIKGRNRSN